MESDALNPSATIFVVTLDQALFNPKIRHAFESREFCFILDDEVHLNRSHRTFRVCVSVLHHIIRNLELRNWDAFWPADLHTWGFGYCRERSRKGSDG